MAEARFTVSPGESVTAFALGPLEERFFPGEPAPMRDTVDYRFVNGFVDVGDLPCRTATWEEVRTRPTPALAAFQAIETRLPGRGRRLDFSGFWHLPTRLTRWARTRLTPTAPGPHRLTLTTCGGVHLWVDGTHITAFEPFRRNAPQSTEVILPLAPAGSEIVLRAEEMAERDTAFFVELTWQGPGDLVASLPGGSDAKVLDALMAMARDIRPARPVLGADERLLLVCDTPAPVDVSVAAEIGQSVHLTHLPPVFTAQTVIPAGATCADLGPLNGLPDGYHPLSLTFSAGETLTQRDIAFARHSQADPQHLPGNLGARKARALAHSARHGEPRAGRLIAMQATGAPFDEAAAAILDDTLLGIEERRDCSDFVMVPLLWLWHTGRDWLPEEASARTRAAIAGYRYWMDEAGNDAMWFWSENHVLCFHVSEYLAGAAFPDTTFPNSGLTGAGHRALAEVRLTRWFDAIEAHGLAEWNSAAYYPIDFIGLLALAQLGAGAIAGRARAALDRLFEMIALHTLGGVAAGSMGRAYDKELRAGPLTELAPFAAVAFGRGWLNAGVAALPMFCAGGYTPPEGLARLAAPEPGDRIEARYVQGYGAAGRLALCKTTSMQLSAAIDGAPGARGHQQHLVDVQAAADPFARLWINHPGEDDPWGSARPSYWAGNGIMPRVGMAEDTALLLFDPGRHPAVEFTHAYAPLARFDAHRSGPDWIVLASGAGWVALKTTEPLEPVTKGPGAEVELRAYGRCMGWVVAIGDLPCGGIDSVAAEVARWRLDLHGPVLMLTRPDRPVLSLDWAEGLARDGAPMPFPTDSRTPRISASFPVPGNRT